VFITLLKFLFIFLLISDFQKTHYILVIRRKMKNGKLSQLVTNR